MEFGYLGRRLFYIRIRAGGLFKVVATASTGLPNSIMSSEEPSVEELLEFRSLLQNHDKHAVATHDEWQRTKRQDLFHKGIRETLRAAAQAAASAAPGGGRAASKAAAPAETPKPAKSPILCFAFRETGVCSNDRCRFSHDPAALIKPGGAPAASSVAPTAVKENSIGRSPCASSLDGMEWA